jgi:hypothetical protein
VRQNGMPGSFSCEIHDTSAQRWTQGTGIGVRGYPGDSGGGLVIDNLAVIGNYTAMRTAKAAPENAQVSLESAVITRSFSDYFYIESADRAYGVRVNWPSNRFPAGAKVTVSGLAITNGDGERCIQADTAVASGTSSIAPLAMPNRQLGGGDWNYDPLKGTGQRGVAGGTGPSNIGLLVRTTGKVISQTGSDFTMTDGTGPDITVTMMTGASSVVVGSYVMVTGASSCLKATDGTLVPLIRVRATSDVQQILAP